MNRRMRLFCLSTLLASMVFVPSTAPGFFDNFDGYADTAAFEAAWMDSTGPGLSLNTTTYASGPNAVWNPGYVTNAAASRRQFTPVDALKLEFSFSFYDSTTDNGRDYAQLYSKNGAWANATANILRIGKYNSITTSKYYGYTFLSSGVILGDGATSLTSGYFALGGAANRSVGWHEARITGEADPDHAGMALYKFYIDGVLGGSLANAADRDFDWIVLGSGLTSASAIVFDDVRFEAIPEPSAPLLGFLGMVALVCLRRLRRQRL